MNKATKPWTIRDALACVLVPLVAALIGSAWGVVSAFALGLKTGYPARPTLPYPIYYDYEGSFLFAFAHSFPSLLVIHLVFRLTMADIVRTRFSRPTLFLAACAGPALATASVLTGYVVASIMEGFDPGAWADVLRSALAHPQWVLPSLLLPFAWSGLYYCSAGFLAGLLTIRWAGKARPHAPPPQSVSRPLAAGALGILTVLAACWVVVTIPLKRDADRIGCIMNLRNAQQGMRSYQGMNGHNPGEPGFDKTLFVGPGLFVEIEPVCPGGGTYTWHSGDWPQVGTLALRCSCKDHVPVGYEDW